MNKVDDKTSLKIVRLYQSGITSTAIARQLGISTPWVFHHLRKHNVKSRSPQEAHRKYRLNEDYFKVVDSHEKAQILGMIAADGNVASKRHVFEITLHDEDRYYVEHIRQCIGYEGPLTRLTRKNTDNLYARLLVTSAPFIGHLNNVGIWPKKSLTLPFPTLEQVPAEFVSSYVLGYFEGDGCIKVGVKGKRKLWTSISMCVTKEFGEKLAAIIKRELNIDVSLYLRPIYRQKFVNMFSLEFGGAQQVMAFCRWMYANAPFKMKRKYDIYQRLLAHFHTDGNRIRETNWQEKHRKECLLTRAKTGRFPGRPPRLNSHFISPEGVVYAVSRIKVFAKEMGLQDAILYRMAKGTYLSVHRGWSPASPEQVVAARAAGTLVEKSYEP